MTRRAVADREGVKWPRSMWSRSSLVSVVVALFVVCLVSAVQLLAPREMPFGVTGPSPVVDEVQKLYSLDIQTYASANDLTEAAKRGDIYGGYVPGASTDTLVTVPAKSFFGEIYVRGGFTSAAEKNNRTFTTTVIAPLPTSDRTGALVGLLLLPTLIGAYLVASMLFSVSKTAAVRGRIPIVLAFAVVVALITGIAAGPIIGAFPTSHLWSLLPCFALVAAAVGLAAVALQAVLGKLGTLVVAVLFIVVGGASAGGGGVALLPTYWQRIGLRAAAASRDRAVPQRAVLRRQQHRTVDRRPRRLRPCRRGRHHPGRAPQQGRRRSGGRGSD